MRGAVCFTLGAVRKRARCRPANAGAARIVFRGPQRARKGRPRRNRRGGCGVRPLVRLAARLDEGEPHGRKAALVPGPPRRRRRPGRACGVWSSRDGGGCGHPTSAQRWSLYDGYFSAARIRFPVVGGPWLARLRWPSRLRARCVRVRRLMAVYATARRAHRRGLAPRPPAGGGPCGSPRTEPLTPGATLSPDPAVRRTPRVHYPQKASPYQVSRLRGLVLPFRRCLPALEGASGPRPPASECRKPCGGSLSFRVVSVGHWRSGLPLFLGSGSLPRRPLSGALGLLSVGWRLGGVPPVLVAVFPLSQSEVCRPQGQPCEPSLPSLRSRAGCVSRSSSWLAQLGIF